MYIDQCFAYFSGIISRKKYTVHLPNEMHMNVLMKFSFSSKVINYNPMTCHTKLCYQWYWYKSYRRSAVIDKILFIMWIFLVCILQAVRIFFVVLISFLYRNVCVCVCVCICHHFPVNVIKSIISINISWGPQVRESPNNKTDIFVGV